ncbi:ectoine utilization protein EutA [Cohaesibacter sp. CAU 1516]|uniref:aspartate racemase/maleate isomerase family protein n=1 Tax=Cohaesibacter sp. CAU 1516 TaxID=2576038 RepID=UPI0010FF0FD7|nr:aspartate/glutamate racemase family protein [Cohaesibacter sp. CAU 1516]TLP43895.1 ectoine utilization protein EutA [Cohaesibacter sp. CAU 1516]
MVKQLNLTLSLRNRTVPARIGLILLETDHTTELEFARHMPHDLVGVYANRIPYANPTTPDNLKRMTPMIGERAAQILPEADLDVVYYGCTSASFVIGDDLVAENIRAAKPTSIVVTPTLAAVAACQHLAVSNLAVLTPYLAETSALLDPYMASNGLCVVSHACLGIEDDRIMAALDDKSLIKAAEAADHPEADALFISCTALRAIEVVPILEARLGKPVITSNQAAIWYILRHLGLPQPTRNACDLFRTLSELGQH